ncbi:hypothetical protein A0J61_01905 [Choanephora cucurbitarum]|uniref:Periplasmic binding protein n=1 Tax=Choanephora cucurbitarum TaxID=101091 RepID=A0A1C7NM28_9FUNG|nr:hypothetical protein A0J61_01905 [Choanephora cucurbitarum]
MNLLLKLIVAFTLFSQDVFTQNSTGFDKTVDRYNFKTTMTNVSLSGFTIEYKNYYKVVTNTITSKSYCLVGFEQPIPEGCHSETTVSIPVKSFSVDSDAYGVIPFIELLDLQKNITKTATTNITSPCIANGSRDTNITSPDMIFSFSTSYGATYVDFSANQDTLLPLQKASWLLYIGAFFDLELKSSAVYNQIVNNYNCHKDNLARLGYSPKGVAWTTFESSDSLFTLHSDVYYHQLTMDANAHLVATNMAQPDVFQVNITIQQMNLATALRGADYILDTSQTSLMFDNWIRAGQSYFAAGNPYIEIPAINQHKVYTVNRLINANQVSDWTQRSAARPDLALLDLIKLVYPDFSVPSNDLFPIWLTPYNQVNETRQVLTTDGYGGCQDISMRAFEQSECVLGASVGSTFIERPHLTEGGKAGISVGSIALFFIGVALALWAYRRYRRRQHSYLSNHGFYKLEEM